jgi:hypothetical protein
MKRSKPTSSSKSTPRRPQPEQKAPGGLAALQRLMAEAVMRPLTPAQRMQTRWSPDQKTSEVVAGFIKPNDRLTSFDRLEIYNRQYWFRLLDCLYEDYPGLRAILGTARFHRLSIAYLSRYPSKSPNLRDLGSRLVRFMEEEPVWTRPHRQLALDMARLEWAQVVAFDGETKRAATLKKLAGIPPDKIHLRLQPYITLLDFSYPVDDVMIRLLRRDAKLRGEASNAVEALSHPVKRSIAARIKRKKGWLLVHRQENAVYFKKLTRPQHAILHALDHGASLAAAFSVLAGMSGAGKLTGQEVQEWFRTWAVLQFFVLM